MSVQSSRSLLPINTSRCQCSPEEPTAQMTLLPSSGAGLHFYLWDPLLLSEELPGHAFYIPRSLKPPCLASSMGMWTRSWSPGLVDMLVMYAMDWKTKLDPKLFRWFCGREETCKWYIVWWTMGNKTPNKSSMIPVSCYFLIILR